MKKETGEPGATAGRGRGRLVVVTVLLTLTTVWAAYEALGLRLARTTRVPEPLRQVAAAPVATRGVGRIENSGAKPRNVILFIADGLGFAHLSLARAAIDGLGAGAVWDRFPAVGWQRTHPLVGLLTDSAAGATALATGSQTTNHSIGVDAAGRPLETLFETAARRGYRTGVVTDSYVWDATPAAFVAHSPRRGKNRAEDLLRQLGQSSLELLVGELEEVEDDRVPSRHRSVELLSRRFEVLGPAGDATLMERLATSTHPVAAIFEEDQVSDLESSPALPALVAAAIARLSSDDRPFLLLVECEEPDSASHHSDLPRLLRGLEVIDRTLERILDFASTDGQTLVVFTSDHETGGLTLGIGETNRELEAIWTTVGHTGVAVPLLAYGPGSEAFAASLANWEVGQHLASMLRVEVERPGTH